jgi:phage terminase small subunit
MHSLPHHLRTPAVKVSLREKQFHADKQRFAEEYCVDLNARAAAKRMGLRPFRGQQLLADPIIQNYIAKLQQYRSERLQIKPDHVLRCWEAARRVDYNEFVELRVTCCRYCWGFDHRRQWTLAEIDHRRDVHLARQLQRPPAERVPFDDEGIEAWRRDKLPCRSSAWWTAQGSSEEEAAERASSDHDCPNCCGNGEPLIVFKDTRHLSYGARYIYQGVETGRDGQIKYNLRSRKDFDEMVAKHLGLFPLEGRRKTDPHEMSDDELDAVLSAHGVTVEAEFETVDDEPVALSDS